MSGISRPLYVIPDDIISIERFERFSRIFCFVRFKANWEHPLNVVRTTMLSARTNMYLSPAHMLSVNYISSLEASLLSLQGIVELKDSESYSLLLPKSSSRLSTMRLCSFVPLASSTDLRVFFRARALHCKASYSSLGVG